MPVTLGGSGSASPSGLCSFGAGLLPPWPGKGETLVFSPGGITEFLEGMKAYPMPEPPWNNLFIQNPLRFGLSSDFHLFVGLFFFFRFGNCCF